MHMKDKIRGVICNTNDGDIREVLRYLSNTEKQFHIPWCMKIDAPGMILAKSYRDLECIAPQVREIAEQCIWELTLCVYPKNAKIQEIDTYQDFIKSECECSLLYYDCCDLEIYIKDKDFLVTIWNLLRSLQVKDLAYITDASDDRTKLWI